MDIEIEVLKDVLEQSKKMYKNKIRSLSETVEYYGEQLGKVEAQLKKLVK